MCITRKLFGIYESSGTKTCQQYAGTLGNEWTDAQTFAAWEVDYLKVSEQRRFNSSLFALIWKNPTIIV